MCEIVGVRGFAKTIARQFESQPFGIPEPISQLSDVTVIYRVNVLVFFIRTFAHWCFSEVCTHTRYATGDRLFNDGPDAHHWGRGGGGVMANMM